ncbi:hypothetical protein LUQ84_002745 [Hamiltosporidium tvaerminnensis]|nr:hypothetical protein LUQ84_002745 [Hamiltosporidium tvaerminnensis]
MIDQCQSHAEANRYKLNPRKCFYNASTDHDFYVDRTRLEKQVPLEYLGYYFNNKCAGTMKSLKFIRQKAVRAAVITNKLLRNTQYSNNNPQYYQLKLRMYTTFIRLHIDYYA